jgi:tetratricopeptide (TPR) repeat protein
MPQPICFMVMPYGIKDTGVQPGQGPPKVNFDALWQKAFEPLIKDLGYEPVRADQDIGALIVHEMLERLYFSDLVLADMTLPNGNVYYEVGIRHAAKERGCVLIGADWSRPLFDLDQARRVRYPLPEGDIKDQTANIVRERLKAAVPHLAAGVSPMVQALPGFPEKVDPNRAITIRNLLQELAQFQARVRTVHMASKAERAIGARKLREEYPASQVKVQSVALDVVRLLQNCAPDCASWEDVLDYIDGLSPEIRDLPVIQEQRCLALSKMGNHLEAIAALEALIQMRGPTSEREGLIGGRFKKLYTSAQSPGDKAHYLAKAIEHYERGMMLDLNDYYPSSNLPRLYRARGSEGDEERARAVAQLVLIACRRAKERDPHDEWVRPTLLGIAFDEADVSAARKLTEEVKMEGADTWKLETTIQDLENTVNQTQDEAKREALTQLLGQLRALL